MTGQPAVSNSYRSDEGCPQNTALEGIETAVAVPVRWDGELKGALSVAFCSMRRVTDEDIASLQALADLAGVACTNAQAFEHAQTAARTDSLTGLAQPRRGATGTCARRSRAPGARGEPLCCLLADLDNFKPINDQHGHLAGDRILKEVAAQLNEEFRAYDGIGRFGGDEFVVVLPGMTEERGRPRGRAVPGRGGRRPPHAGLGRGADGLRWGSRAGTSRSPPPELVDRADRALLVAKRSGKDRAVLSSHSTEDELARLESSTEAPTRVLADLWDMISHCERPTEVLDAPARASSATRSAWPTWCCWAWTSTRRRRELCRALEGAAIARPSLLALRKALGAWDLPVEAARGRGPRCRSHATSTCTACWCSSRPQPALPAADAAPGRAAGGPGRDRAAGADGRRVALGRRRARRGDRRP